jgi:hypothetical protein
MAVAWGKGNPMTSGRESTQGLRALSCCRFNSRGIGSGPEVRDLEGGSGERLPESGPTDDSPAPIVKFRDTFDFGSDCRMTVLAHTLASS